MQFEETGAIEITSLVDTVGDEADDEGEELMSKVGSEENYSTRPAPSSMAAPSVTFSFAETSDLGDSVSVRDQEMDNSSSYSVAAWRTEVVRQSPAEEDRHPGIIVSTPPPRLGYDHGTEPIQNYETQNAARSVDFTPPVGSRVEETLQENGIQLGPGPQTMPEMEPENLTAPTEKAEEEFSQYENQRTRLTSTKIKGLVGLFFNILFWGGLYIGLNFAPK